MSHCFFSLICLLLALVHFSLYCWFLASWLQEHFIYYLLVLSSILSVFCGIYLLTLLILAPLENFYFHMIKLIIGFWYKVWIWDCIWQGVVDFPVTFTAFFHSFTFWMEFIMFKTVGTGFQCLLFLIVGRVLYEWVIPPGPSIQKWGQTIWWTKVTAEGPSNLLLPQFLPLNPAFLQCVQ